MAVLEIAPLPVISRLEEAPIYVIGVVHLHGRIVPIVDMHLRLGYAKQAYRLEDCIVFLERQGKTIGILVTEALAVQDLDEREFAPMSDYGAHAGVAEPELDHHFVLGIATWGEKMVMVLHVETLLHVSQSLADRYGSSESLNSNAETPVPAEITPGEASILRERTIKLAQLAVNDERAASLPCAIARIGEEFFGIELEVVREFAELRHVTPIPCCPDHVIGQINLRGDLITIIDVSKTLSLPPLQRDVDRRVVVMNDSKLAVGVVVDELLGVVYLNTGDVSPAHRTSGSLDQGYRRGSVTDGPRTLSLIDLPALLRQRSLLVNEKPS